MSKEKRSHGIKIGIPMVGEYEYKVESESETGDDNIGVLIQSPKNGATISPNSNDAFVIVRPIMGMVFGFNRRDLKMLQLTVEVSILTNKWYDQGAAEVRDGRWALEKAYFGGIEHRIRAVLKDKYGKERAVKEVVVTVMR